MDIHIRTTIPDFYSYIEAAAIRVDESVVEMSIGNTHSFFINGKEFTDEGGKYTLQIGTQLQDGRGTIYNLDAGSTTVQIRVMKFLMSVDLQGVDPSIKEYGTGGLIGKFPTGEWLGRDQDTLFAYDGVSQSIHGREEPVCNTIGQEWQVRDTDPQLFREIREPAWPRRCQFPKESVNIQSRRRLSASVDEETTSQVCALLHPKDSADFEFCVMDVIRMDDIDAAYSW